MLKTLSYEYIWKFFKLYSLIYITIFSFIFFPREHHLVLGICHFQSFLLLFFCCKELGSYLLHIDWWRKLFFYCIVKLALGHILLQHQKLLIFLGFCIVDQGNGLTLLLFLIFERPLLDSFKLNKYKAQTKCKSCYCQAILLLMVHSC